MKKEIWKNFKCKKCEGVFLIEITVPYIGWRCKWCDFVHLFKKGDKEIVCNTLQEVKK